MHSNRRENSRLSWEDIITAEKNTISLQNNIEKKLGAKEIYTGVNGKYQNSYKGGHQVDSKTEKHLEKILGNAGSECSITNEEDKTTCVAHIPKVKSIITEAAGTKNMQQAMEKLKQETGCDNGICVLRSHSEIKAKLGDEFVENLIKKYFKPPGPAESTGLLSNFNIDDVLDQLADKYKDFYHIPFQMRDWHNNPEFKEINLARDVFDRRYRRFGVVFNTDFSTGRGIHWFCVYGELSEDGEITIEYFNSSGQEMLPEIQDWINHAVISLEKNLKGRKTKETGILVNNVRSIWVSNAPLQEDQHSCGVWSIFYILMRLMGYKYSWFSAKNVNDAVMLKMREYLFIDEKKKKVDE